MTEILVDVTQADVDLGEPQNRDTCPVAVAMTRAIGQHVWTDGHMFQTRSRMLKGWLPDEAVAWIIKYDAGDTMSPIQFYVEI